MRPQDLSPRRLPPEWLKAVLEEQTKRPPDRLVPLERDARTGDDPPETYVHSTELDSLISFMKQQRTDQGLSLGDIARMTQQARSAISRLENGRYTNPTLHTLYRYARALGLHIKLSAEFLTDEQRDKDEHGTSDPDRS